MRILTRTLLIVALSAPFAVSAQNPPTEPSKAGGAPKAAGDTTKKAGDTAKKERLGAEELQIMAHYHADNLAEIELGKAAGKRGASQAVKAHGEMLVTDHRDFDQKLLALAKKTGQTIPAEKPENEAKKAELAASKKRAADLMKLTGAAFDREYTAMMVDEHKRAVANIDAHIAAAKHPELAALLTEVKPVLQRHADRAHEAHGQTPTATK